MTRRSRIAAIAGFTITFFGASSTYAVGPRHVVTATSFADPEDIAHYNKCLAEGLPPLKCQGRGDNGIGLWGDDTTDISKPMCALPREDWMERWKSVHAARGRKISVSMKGKTVICELRDTLPRRANSKSGAGIDLNPGAARAFGLKPGFKIYPVTWFWAE